MCHQWYLYDSSETFTLGDVLHNSSLVQPEAFSETSGLATILPANATRGLTMFSFQYWGREEGGGTPYHKAVLPWPHVHKVFLQGKKKTKAKPYNQND